MMLGPLIAMGFGLLNTTGLHLAKGLLRRGFGENRSRTAYALGFVMTHSSPVWIVLSNRFAPSSYFTSMYGLGLVVLLWYSHRYLGEQLTRTKLIGASVLVLGTLLLGIDGVLQPAVSAVAMDPVTIWILLGALVGGFSLLAAVMRNGLAFGLLTGTMAAFDPILKSFGQARDNGMGFFPLSISGWIPFGLSFLFALGAFVLINLAFARNSRASLLVPSHTAAFVAIPAVVQSMSIPGFGLTLLTAVGIGIIGAGAFLVQKSKE
jgi:hypothetical protein